MGFTLEEAEALGIAHEHPDHPDNKPAVRRRRVPTTNPLGQNKTEAAYDRHLEDLKRSGVIRDFRWEPIKIRLAGRTWLRIDFIVQRLDGSLAAIDVKGGHIEDDAAVKIKVAPEVFPFMDYFLVCRDGQRWSYRKVGRKGIGLVWMGCPWMEDV